MRATAKEKFMKRIHKMFTALCAAIAAVVLAISFAACATDVAGKIYKFETVELNTEEELTELEQAAADLVVAAAKEVMADMTIEFSEDGSVVVGGTIGDATTGTYTQDGDIVSFTGVNDVIAAQATASGNTLEFLTEESGFSVKVIFKLQ